MEIKLGPFSSLEPMQPTSPRIEWRRKAKVTKTTVSTHSHDDFLFSFSYSKRERAIQKAFLTKIKCLPLHSTKEALRIHF